MRDDIQVRTFLSDLKTRKDGEDPRIEGYFAVFNTEYEMWEDCIETIAPGAFTESISGDIRALVDHNTNLVLGRTAANTLEIKQDDKGLWGSIKINPNDSDAMNLYARVQRGDVSQCSFGCRIEEEDHCYKDGKHYFTLTKVKLYEVSCCTFPAYEETSISARKRDVEALEQRKAEVWRENAMKRVKEVVADAESADAESED